MNLELWLFSGDVVENKRERTHIKKKKKKKKKKRSELGFPCGTNDRLLDAFQDLVKNVYDEAFLQK